MQRTTNQINYNCHNRYIITLHILPIIEIIKYAINLESGYWKLSFLKLN